MTTRMLVDTGVGNDHLTVERSDHVAVVTMNRPDARNAWSGQMILGMKEAWDHIDGDDGIRVAVLTGAGGTFCAGADLKEMSAGRGGGDDGFSDRVRAADHAFEAMLRNRRLTKPLIAAVEGYALAGGTEILQACDIRVAARGATFGLTEVRRALFPLGGSTVRLPRQIPYTMAAEILLLGEHVDAETAHRIGLVGRLVDDGQALDEALRLADRIAANGPLAVRNILRAMRETAALPEEQALERSLELGLEVFASEDAKEGPRAFAEGREPEFQGR